ncbi:MAG: hypothetical protein ACLURP_01410 [Ruminococcus sp.]
MEEALKNTCQMAPPLIYTNDKNKSGGSFMENGAFCLSKSDKVMGVRAFHKYKRIWSDFRIFTLVSFKDWHSLWEVICTFYLQAETKVQFTVQMRVI